MTHASLVKVQKGHGKAMMTEERLEMVLEEPSSDYSCSNAIIMAIHVAILMAPRMALP